MRKFLLGVVAAFALVSTLAAVNGFFNYVNSVHGYKVNGSAGSVGNGLCSDGTYYNTPCSAGSVFYQTIQEAGSSLPQQPLLNFDGTVVAANGSGKTNVGLPSLGTAGTYALPASITFDAQGRETAVTAGSAVARTCNSNGCYDISATGTVHEWGHVSTPVDGAPGNNVCLPFAFPNNFDKAVVTDDFSVGATGTPSVASLSPSGSASPFPCANGGFLVRQTRVGNGVYWDATGN